MSPDVSSNEDCVGCGGTGIELVVIDNPYVKQARFRRCEVCQPPLWIRNP